MVISQVVRLQPRQKPEVSSILQTEMQGEGTMAYYIINTMDNKALTCCFCS